MANSPVYVGIDVAKATLDVAVSPTAERWTLAYTEREVAGLVTRLRWTSGGGVGEANASGLGAITLLKKEEAQAKGRAVYQDGRYRLVMKRPRAAPTRAAAPPFPVGTFIPVAFQAWDGDNGEVGGKMSLSSWYYLRLEPSPSIARWLYPPLVAIAVLGFELWGFSWARRRLRG